MESYGLRLAQRTDVASGQSCPAQSSSAQLTLTPPRRVPLRFELKLLQLQLQLQAAGCSTYRWVAKPMKSYDGLLGQFPQRHSTPAYRYHCLIVTNSTALAYAVPSLLVCLQYDSFCVFRGVFRFACLACWALARLRCRRSLLYQQTPSSKDRQTHARWWCPKKMAHRRSSC